MEQSSLDILQFGELADFIEDSSSTTTKLLGLESVTTAPTEDPQTNPKIHSAATSSRIRVHSRCPVDEEHE